MFCTFQMYQVPGSYWLHVREKMVPIAAKVKNKSKQYTQQNRFKKVHRKMQAQVMILPLALLEI